MLFLWMSQFVCDGLLSPWKHFQDFRRLQTNIALQNSIFVKPSVCFVLLHLETAAEVVAGGWEGGSPCYQPLASAPAALRPGAVHPAAALLGDDGDRAHPQIRLPHPLRLRGVLTEVPRPAAQCRAHGGLCPRSLAAGPKTRPAHPENPGASGRPQPPSSKRAQGPFLMPRGRSFEMTPVPAFLFWRRLAAEYVASRSNQSLKQIPTFRAECHRGDVWPGSRKSVLSFPQTLSHPKVWTARVQGPH